MLLHDQLQLIGRLESRTDSHESKRREACGTLVWLLGYYSKSKRTKRMIHTELMPATEQQLQYAVAAAIIETAPSSSQP